MERKYVYARGKQVLKILVLIAGLLLLCFLCAAAGYFFVRAQNKTGKTEQSGNINEYNLPQKSQTPFNLPTLQIAENVTLEPSFAPTESKTEYLVIAEGEIVKLYALTQDGTQIFQKNLEISLSALTEEDRAVLKEGIILKSEDELSSLLEDYTS